ncbi:MAG: NADH-quinone oxidoreductase subunit NuoE [Trichloromonadaceae bacterium]
MNALLPADIIEAFSEKAATIPHPMELVVDVLRAIQDHHGWVPDEGVELAARILGTSALKVEEIATFYDKIYRRPVGRRVIHLCDSICCWSREAEAIFAYLQHKLGIALGETTADGLFTLLPACCLGACGEAPAMMIGLTTYGNLTPEKIDAILEQHRAEVVR